MINKLNIILALTSVAALVGVYGLKYSVQEIASAKTALQRTIEHQKADLSLLQADWSYLNQPAHIQPIVDRHADALGLQSIKQTQFGAFVDLPMRPAAPDTDAMTQLFQSLANGVDPADKPLGGQ